METKRRSGKDAKESPRDRVPVLVSTRHHAMLEKIRASLSKKEGSELTLRQVAERVISAACAVAGIK